MHANQLAGRAKPQGVTRSPWSHCSRPVTFTGAPVAEALAVSVLASVLLIGAHPGFAERAGRRMAGLARHVCPGIDPRKVAQTSKRLASLAGPR